MNCFVASAFDHNDVDTIYDRAIKLALKELKFTTYRVDRHEHNDDIDDKIFELLDKADLCIADLTFARPSVYYEAGYAMGKGTPIIYIARRDHFKPNPADVAGNLRIHFDLQMKNLIPWIMPTTTFKNALKRRIVKVMTPLLKKQEKEKARDLEARSFQQQPLSSKVASLTITGQRLLERRKFLEGNSPYFGGRYLHRTINSIDHNAWLAAFPSVAKKTFWPLRDITTVLGSAAGYGYAFYCTLGPARVTTIFNVASAP